MKKINKFKFLVLALLLLVLIMQVYATFQMGYLWATSKIPFLFSLLLSISL